MASCDDLICKQQDLPYECYQVFRDMRQKKEFFDVTLNVGNNSIQAHKIILAGCIPYFRSLFGFNATEDGEREVWLTNVSPAALEMLIDFAYTCELRINAANVRMLLSAACSLKMDHVKKACIEFLINEITPSCAINVRDVGVGLNCVELINEVDVYIKENFEDVSQSEEFLCLPYLYLKALISSDDLHVTSEEKVFEGMMRWIRAQPDERSPRLATLLSCVRMPFVKRHYLKDVIAPDQLIKKSLECRDILDDARDYHLFPEKRHDADVTWKFSCTPRQRDQNQSAVVNSNPSLSRSGKDSAGQENFVLELSNIDLTIFD